MSPNVNRHCTASINEEGELHLLRGTRMALKFPEGLLPGLEGSTSLKESRIGPAMDGTSLVTTRAWDLKDACLASCFRGPGTKSRMGSGLSSEAQVGSLERAECRVCLDADREGKCTWKFPVSTAMS